MKSVLLVALCACTTLGPMPATTGISAVPAGRPGLEAQFGGVPGYYLSRSAQGKAGGAVIQHLSAMLDLDRWTGLRGLIVGGRIMGQDQDTPGEPMLGYRTMLGEGLSLGGVVFGAAKRATRQLATYHGVQYGSELALDARLVDASWFALHAQAAGSVTRTVASGMYCVDMNGLAIDCKTDGTPNTMIDGRLSGAYPAATGMLELALFPHSHSYFHGLDLAMLVGLGEMPIVKNGVQQSATIYQSIGITLTLGLGAVD